MKATSLLICIVSTATLVSCSQTPVVQVIDSKTKLPVAGAEVRARSGDYYSASNFTDGNGATAEPGLPGGASELEIERSGYETTRIKY